MAGHYEPAIDSEKAGGRENDLRGDEAGRIGLNAKRGPKAVGYEKQHKPPARVFGVERQKQRTGYAGRAACPLEGVKGRDDHDFLAILAADLTVVGAVSVAFGSAG